jgi:site-specific DNA recombinase
VQAKLDQQLNNHKATRSKSDALLMGRIFDDRGNVMSPSHTRRRGIKYRYYLSSALLNGTPGQAGSVRRAPAEEIEALIIKTVRDQHKAPDSIDDRQLIATHVARVDVHPEELVVHLAPPQGGRRQRPGKARTIRIPWHKPPSKRRREILLPDNPEPKNTRPIRSETRATLIASIARGRKWLNEMVSDATASVDDIAKREGCSVRQVNMTISLAFVAPDLVKAILDGRFPRGIGVTQLRDAPPEWFRQYRMLGLTDHLSRATRQERV